jgi:hypothetical protein
MTSERPLDKLLAAAEAATPEWNRVVVPWAPGSAPGYINAAHPATIAQLVRAHVAMREALEMAAPELAAHPDLSPHVDLASIYAALDLARTLEES